MNMHSTS